MEQNEKEQAEEKEEVGILISNYFPYKRIFFTTENLVFCHSFLVN